MSDMTTVEDDVVHLDYRTFQDVVFKNCKLVYSGGQPPGLKNVSIIDSEFVFEAAAINTLKMLQIIAHGGDADLVVTKMLGLEDWSKNG